MALIDAPIVFPGKYGHTPINRSKAPSVILCITSLTIVAVSLFFIIGAPQLHQWWPYAVIGMSLFWTLIFVMCSKLKYGTPYLFSNAFLFVLFIFHLSWPGLYTLGGSEFGFIVTGDAAVWFERAAWCVTLSLGGFGFGVACARHTDLSGPFEDIVENEKNGRLGIMVAYWAGFGLALASLLSVLLLVVSVGNVFNYSRLEIYNGVGDTRGLGLALMLAPTALILLVCTVQSTKQKIFIYSCALIISFLIMFLGERSAVMFPVLTGLIIWRKLGRKVSVKILFLMIALSLVLIPAVSQLRSLGKYSDISKKDISQSFSEAKSDSIPQELGAIQGVLANVLMWVPRNDPYRYGASYLMALGESIPNVGFKNRGNDRDAVNDASGDKDAVARKLSPGNWYIYKANRWMFEHGGGGGFSLLAEAYLNFGVIGLVMIPFLLGLIFGKIDSVDLSKSPIWLLSAAIAFWPLLKVVRNDFGNFTKPVGLVLAALLIWWLVSPLFGMRLQAVIVRKQTSLPSKFNIMK